MAGQLQIVLLQRGFRAMSDDEAFQLIAASLAGGIIAAQCPMTASEAVAIFNHVKIELRRQTQLEGLGRVTIVHHQKTASPLHEI
jgi:hypothetical protein